MQGFFNLTELKNPIPDLPLPPALRPSIQQASGLALALLFCSSETRSCPGTFLVKLNARSASVIFLGLDPFSVAMRAWTLFNTRISAKSAVLREETGGLPPDDVTQIFLFCPDV